MLWDPGRRETIRQDNLHLGADYTPFEGMEVIGGPVMTLLRGISIAEEGRILGQPGDGAYLERGHSNAY